MEDDLVAQRTVLGDGLETTEDPDPLFIYEGLVFFLQFIHSKNMFVIHFYLLWERSVSFEFQENCRQ